MSKEEEKPFEQIGEMSDQQNKYQRAFNKILSRRYDAKEEYKKFNRLVDEGTKHLTMFPDRWYVRNPKPHVTEFLEQKHGKPTTDCSNKGEPTEDPHNPLNVGYGEMHGEFWFVPHDVEYPYEITQEEFDKIYENVFGEKPA